MRSSIPLGFIAAVLIASAGCDSRAVQSDGAVADGGPSDATGRDGLAPDRGSPSSCEALTLVGDVRLGQAPPNLNETPALTHVPGQGFSLVWTAQRPESSELVADLVFARLDYSARVLGAKEVVVAKDAELRRRTQLVFSSGSYGVLYSKKAGGGVALLRLDAKGTAVAILANLGQTDAALAPHPAGFAVLHAPQRAMLSDVFFARYSNSALIKEHQVASTIPSWRPWLVRHAAGYAAGWGEIFLPLDDKGFALGPQTTAIDDKSITEPSYVPSAAGYGVIWARSSDFMVRGRVLDTQGKPKTSAVSIGRANIGAAPLQQLFLAWTGSHYLLAYPADKPGAHATVRVLDGATLAPKGEPLALPSCLSWGSGPVTAAYGNGRFAVGYVGGLSGPVGSAVCVASVACQ
jgi:hypothetical protein